MDQRGHGDVFQGSEFAQEVMELKHQSDVFVSEAGELRGREFKDIFAREKDASSRRIIKGSQQMEKRRFTSTASAADAHHRGRFHRQIDSFKDFKFVSFVQEFSLKSFDSYFEGTHARVVQHPLCNLRIAIDLRS